MKNEGKEVSTSNNVQPAVVEKEITNDVLQRVNSFQENGELKIPEDYSPENALKSAYLILSDLKDKNGTPILEACSKKSIANALLKMVVEGLSPMKKQCYFIPYGKELTLIRSFQGSIALARRVGGVSDVVANVIYKNDSFEFGVDLETGRRKILKHEQSLSNISNSEIIGAYAFVINKDGSKGVEIMTIEEIRTAWNQGQTNGNSPAHKNFTQEMSKKTVINRACKNIINSSTDAFLIGEDEDESNEEKFDSKVIEIKSEIISSKPETIAFEESKPEAIEKHLNASLFPKEEPKEENQTDAPF